MIDLPEMLVIQKCGAEASAVLSQIIAIKNIERKRNTHHRFLWGVGTSIADASLIKLLSVTNNKPEVFFIAEGDDVEGTRGRATDRRYIDNDEKCLKLYSDYTLRESVLQKCKIEHDDQAWCELRKTSQVTAHNRAAHHYALVCESDDELQQIFEPIDFSNYWCVYRSGSTRGAADSGRRTADVVQRKYEKTSKGNYTVRLRARLVEPYFVDCVDVEPHCCRYSEERHRWMLQSEE